MITRPDGERVLVDREDLARITRLSQATIRARCQPVDYDRATHRALYDLEQCQEQLQDVKRRRVVAQ